MKRVRSARKFNKLASAPDGLDCSTHSPSTVEQKQTLAIAGRVRGRPREAPAARESAPGKSLYVAQEHSRTCRPRQPADRPTGADFRQVGAVDQPASNRGWSGGVRGRVTGTPSAAEPEGFQVQIWVNDVEMTAAGAGLGMDPYDVLIPRNRFAVDDAPKTIPVARCNCGVYGCGSTDDAKAPDATAPAASDQATKSNKNDTSKNGCSGKDGCSSR